MDNKKQLIIVPPMSEALKKLHEVLEGIASDENIEISMIDDLKELGQVLATAGQCLILTSSAKKCATFLQENKATINRTHAKTMLFTPKEIPAKTLIKFTKVGLTESILENSAPKTLLYKIKLQLRSIKSVATQQEKEKEVVKNLIDTTESKPAEDEKVREITVNEKIVANDNQVKKKNGSSEENVIDYGSNLKGKIKPQEETIDTHWKSKRKTDESKLDIEESEDNDNPASDAKEDIDLYYRGKRKKIDLLLEEENEFSKLKKLDNDDSETESKDRKKKTSFLDSLEEGYLKQKRLDTDSIEEEMDYHNKPEDISLEIDPADKVAKNNSDYETDEENEKKSKKTLSDLEAADKTKRKNSEVEDLGGHLKGKLSQVKDEDESELEQDSKEDYDNNELELNPGKSIELDLIAAKKKTKEKVKNEDAVNDPHEGEVDHLSDEAMNGKGATDHIETFMGGKTTTRKAERELDQDEELKKERPDFSKDDQDNIKKPINLDLTPGDKPDREKNDYDNSTDDISLKTSKDIDLLLSEEDVEKETPEHKTDEAEKDQATTLDLIPGDSDHNKNKNKNEAEDSHMSFRKLNNTQLDIEPNKKNDNKSKVDKIDTYYRSGDTKKKDHSWENLTDKEKSVNLDLIKSHKADEHMAGRQKTDLGEVTIDYRVLKKEFDMIARGEATGGHSVGLSGENGPSVGAEDDASFKVAETDPRAIVLSIHLINSLINKTIKPKQMFSLIAGDILDNYKGHCVFFSFKQSEDKYIETFSSYMDLFDQRITEAKKQWWLEFKKSTELFKYYQSKSMSTWRSPEVIENDAPWEDVELPKWARQELTDKQVELIFPYFDGLDKMGLALVFFPEGINPDHEKDILTSLELARALFLDTIQRYQIQPEKIKLVDDEQVESVKEKKNILSFFGGMFGRKKAG